ncbi:MAG: EAL domain-containing protein [Acetivibrionales bacterium]|jgi:diguanylate cyclase (GGDEF)-like protein/PAS domain S-box-containing protein
MKQRSKTLKHSRKYMLFIFISLIFGGFAIFFTNAYLNDMIERSLVEIAKMGAKTIEQKVEWNLNRLDILSNLEIIYSDRYTIEEKLNYLRETSEKKNSAELAYITADGMLYGVSGRQFDVSREKFFLNAMKSTHSIEKTYMQFYPVYPSVVFTVPVIYDNNIKSFVSIIYSAEEFCAMVENITFGEKGYGYIIDSEGVTIAHTDRSLVINKVISINDAQEDPDLKQLADLEKKMLLGQTGAGPYLYKGQRKIMGFTKIANLPWSFAATAPKTDVFGNANAVLIIVALVVFSFGLSLILINLYFVALNRKIEREERTLKNVVETANIIIISFLDDGVILEFNVNAADRLGYDRDKIIKTFSIYDLLPQKEQIKLKNILESHKQGLSQENFELSINTADGETEHVLFNINIVDKESFMPVYELMGICITERVMSEIQLMEKHQELTEVYEKLAASEEELKEQLEELIKQKMLLQEKDERHNLIVDASNIGIWDWDVKNDTYFYSQKWYDILEIERDKIEGKEREYKIDAVLEEDKKIPEKALLDYTNRKTTGYECEYRVKTPDGKIKWIYEAGKALFDRRGKVIKMAGAYFDITTKKESEERIHRLAFYDALTGLPNRSRLTEKYFEIADSPERKIAIIIVDIDNFKLINDSYGHEIGDKLLVEVTNRLNSIDAGNSYISRMAGDDFAIMVWDFESKSELIEIINKLIDNIEGMVLIENYYIVVSLNIGVSLCPDDANSFDILYKNADTAKHKADERRAKYAFYDKDMNDAILERLNLQNSMKTALDKNEFILHYQPQYRAADRKIMGFEALVRWNSESMGMISPAKFIPIAEETHLIIPLGMWILEEAVKFIKKLYQRGYTHLIMSVNISAIQFIQKDFSENVIDLLRKYCLPPESLELEITESVMMQSMDNVLDNIKRVREVGIKIALDDFGTGYSSLNYLTKIPINTLKIDKTFIDDIGLKKERSLLIESIVGIGHRLGLSIVAEGVETEDQYIYLMERKCERIQGYFFSKPLPEDQVMHLFEDV